MACGELLLGEVVFGCERHGSDGLVKGKVD